MGQSLGVGREKEKDRLKTRRKLSKICIKAERMDGFVVLTPPSCAMW